jgi:glycogen debranching enzyme
LWNSFIFAVSGAALLGLMRRRLGSVVKGVEATVHYRGAKFELACNEFLNGTLAPRGYELLSSFHLENGLPVWTYAFADALLEQGVWMAHGRNATYVSFTLRSAGDIVDLELLPLCSYRDYHGHTQGGPSFEVSSEERGCQLTAGSAARP